VPSQLVFAFVRKRRKVEKGIKQKTKKIVHNISFGELKRSGSKISQRFGQSISPEGGVGVH
jgi:hypothetical protein